jgi:hypothetical protein
MRKLSRENGSTISSLVETLHAGGHIGLYLPLRHQQVPVIAEVELDGHVPQIAERTGRQHLPVLQGLDAQPEGAGAVLTAGG